MNERRESYLAIVNPAAGGGRSRKFLGPALERLRAGGVEVDVVETQGAGDATRIAREAYGSGRRRFIAVGGDGT
ncbi:MAG: acylglycerol kinase family protein, partial [Candidatus Sulfotelmatobacter sp.]